MKAWFDDIEIGSSICFIIQTVERSTSGHGPPLGLTYTFNGGREVPLKLDKVEDGQAYYKIFEKEKREDMARTKKMQTQTTTTTKGMPLNAAVAQTAAPSPSPEKSDPPKYLDMDTADELWELDFPDKPELFRQLIEQRLGLKYEVDAMEERIKEINGALLPFFERNNMPGVKLENGALVRRHEGQSVTLDKGALVLAGVPAGVIEKCTVRKKFVTVMVRGPKEG